MRNTHTVGSGILQETLKNVQYDKQTLWDLHFDEKTEKRGQ